MSSAIEDVLDQFGLMRGQYATVSRAAVGALAGAFIVQRLQPPSMYINGVARSWSLVSATPEATPLPWFAVPAFGAFVMGVLI